MRNNCRLNNAQKKPGGTGSNVLNKNYAMMQFKICAYHHGHRLLGAGLYLLLR